jgi:dienelactone hydrolase
MDSHWAGRLGCNRSPMARWWKALPAATLPAAALLAGLTAGTAACTTGQAASPHAAIWVSAPAALADQAIDIRVTGLAAGERVTITAQATDAKGQAWQAKAAFTASGDGVLDLAKTAPESGSSYHGADAMGLLWSMAAVSAAADQGYFDPAPPQRESSFAVRLTVASSGGRVLGSRLVSRDWMAPGERARVLAGSVKGVLFTPPPGTPRHPGVLVFGGAEGGMSQVYTAALLAAHGYPALTVAYFDWPGRPANLSGIPLEYFAAAGRLLAAQPDADPAHVLVMGYSRGSEAALLLANDFPQEFHGAVVYSPSSDVNYADTPWYQPAWTLGGRGIYPQPIQMNHVSGPVLAFAGGDDAQWDSGQSAQVISEQMVLAHSQYKGQAFLYPDAGHGVGTFPYQPISTQAIGVLGGTRAGDVAAQRDGWGKVLNLLGQLAG